MGVMTSMNAVGPVWAGGCKALLTNILRDEWGFHGAVITDAVVSPWYMDGNLAIRTGGTKMLAFNITNEFYRDLNSVGTVTAMRNAAHGTLYALANSFAVTRAVSVPKWVKRPTQWMQLLQSSLSLGRSAQSANTARQKRG